MSGTPELGRGIRAGVRRLFRLPPRTRAQADADADAELDAFLEARIEHLVARGMTPAEARAEALRRLGAPLDDVRASLQHSAERREGRRRVLDWAEAVLADVRFAARQFVRTPGFTVTAVLVLALGIGATTAIFSAVRAVVLRPLPFAQPERLYMLWESNREMGSDREVVSPPNYLDWKERVSSFADVEAYGSAPFQVTITGLGEPLVLDGVPVTGGFFSMLGVRPMLGRDFTEAETWAEATWRAGETPLLLSARTWRTVFGGEASAIGRAVELNGGHARIVGVMPEGFAFPSEAVDLWMPSGWASENREAAWYRRDQSIRPIARLAPGATPERARAELETVAAQLAREHPATNTHVGAGLSPLHAFLVGDVRTPLLILLGAVGLMLLIACANVGNLLLVRASGRRQELAVRAALGAGRGRLVRQMLAESLALASLGGAFGIALGVAGTRLLERLQPAGLLRVTTFPVDAGVVAFAVLATVTAALLFGAFPALLARRSGPGEALREGGRTGGVAPGTRRVVGGLVVAEVALATLLVLGAGLLVRSTIQLRQVDPGFDPDGVVAISINLPGSRYPGPPTIAAFYDELLARIRAIPGVESVAASSTLPLRDRGATSDFFIAGRAPDAYGTEVVRRSVTPGYFETMGVPLLAGRGFTDADTFTDRWDEPRDDRVALINAALARQYFPGQDPVGQRITTDRVPDSTSQWRTIVGVVGNERQSEIAMPAQIELIEPFGQAIDTRMHIYVRMAGGEPTRVVPAVRAIVRELDPELPLIDAVAMEDVVADSMALDRFLMLLLGAFAAVALVLALVGVYGITAQVARQRLPEFGLRMALGARARDILGLTLRRGLSLVIIGLALGVAAALTATRAMAGLLYGITPNDPTTFLTVTSLLVAAGFGASWLPARRAARLDPATTLRAE
ncbi:MAG TPA: ABC transporter permease [Gemmatimonadaceae bacterium]|nr:ABC transporter permease [Gemmatimonadaceae bacterium]